MKPSLIDKQTIRTSYGTIAYLEAGAAPKPPVLFVHGIPTSGYLWRQVMRFLQNDFHCYAPDLMGLGDTEVDPSREVFHMEAQAEMLLELMDELGHERFALVCHDQGGAAAQLIAARQPERVSCFGITNCVCYDNWPVPPVRLLQQLARVGALTDAAGRSGVLELLLTRGPRSPIRRGLYRTDKFRPEVWREYLRPLRGNRAERERMRAFLMAGHPRYTLQAAEGLRRFDRPTIVIWPGDDVHLSPSWGRKLFEEIPGAERFELVPFCGHFWQEERPSEFASLLGEFLAEHLLRRPAADRGAARDEPSAPQPPAELPAAEA